MSPDLVVVDERSDPKGEFVNRVKIQKERSLTSIIKLYSKEKDLRSELDFKIWENDFLIEPFEVLELFSLTEAELVRVPKDRKVFQQQVHFEFRTSPENLEKANKLSDLILRQSVPLQDDATALYAAVKEGIDNAFVHGNNAAADKTIDVNFLVDRKKITVIIEDEGEGFDSSTTCRGSTTRRPSRRRRGGSSTRACAEGWASSSCTSARTVSSTPDPGARSAWRRTLMGSGRIGGCGVDLAEARERLRRKLAACIRTGKITLSSGKETDFYFDGRLVSLDPEGSVLIGELFLDEVRKRGSRASGLTSGSGPDHERDRGLAHQRSVPLKLFYVRKARQGPRDAEADRGPPPPGRPEGGDRRST